MRRLALAAAAMIAGTAAGAREPAGLHAALEGLARAGEFSGAVVVRGPEGIRFARGYGLADPFSGRRFTPDTPVDSASLAKPVTAATVLMLAERKLVDLDAPVRTYLAEYPQAETTVRHLLAHSAGLSEEAVGSITNKTNAQLLAEFLKPGVQPLFAAGTGFGYCNLCYSTLALLIERVTGTHYLTAVRAQAAFPPSVTLRPLRLADWRGRAIGYRRSGDSLGRADSYEDEAFYGTANFSISAAQLARWGTAWWQPALAPILAAATTPATIGGRASGLTWGNWYCAPGGRRCHYLGHHEGFHHMLYWDRDRRISVAMVSNNSLAPAIQQRLQRAIVAAAEGRRGRIGAQLGSPLPDLDVAPGLYRLAQGERIIVGKAAGAVTVERGGIACPAYRIGSGIRYVPGLDTYVAAGPDGSLRWLSLYEDLRGVREVR